jgi:16S rRNA (cytosine967-C5)-methyltransferase
MQLAAAGAVVTAVDISRQRLERLKSNAERLRLPMSIVEMDARQWRPEEPLDAVLLDAPCSALGVLRRHPEGAWRRDPADLVRFPRSQRSLLEAAWAMLKPGGVLAYCVCTPTPEEGADVIQFALETGRWERAPVSTEETPGFEHARTASGDLLTLPPSVVMEGPDPAGGRQVTSDVFFVSRLRKRE